MGEDSMCTHKNTEYQTLCTTVTCHSNTPGMSTDFPGVAMPAFHHVPYSMH